ncbi:MAG: flagellar biosynthetic protein FliR [Steroidobacteraceae bacterium]
MTTDPTLAGALATHEWLLRFAAVFARVGAMVMVAPVFGSRLVPRRIRLVLAVALTVFVLGVVPAAPAGIDPLALAGEMALGVAMGFVLQTVFDALVVAGQLVSLGMGLGFANLVDPRHGASIPVVGQLYLILATLVFFTLDGHLAMVGLLADSFRAVPPGAGHLDAAAAGAVVEWGGRILSGALQVALPAVVAMTVVNVAFGVVSRAAPQLNLFGVGFPLALVLGFVTLWMSLGSLAPAFETLLDDALALAGSLPGGAR